MLQRIEHFVFMSGSWIPKNDLKRLDEKSCNQAGDSLILRQWDTDF
jgi:hypothetical protein